MDWQWIKENKKIWLPAIAMVGGIIALIAGVITWDDFISFFKQVQTESGG